MDKYFRLNPEVFLEVGKRGAVLYNLLNNNFIAINEEYKNMLLIAEANREISDNELFSNLEGIGWGKYYSKAVFIDKLRKYNIFTQKKFWKDAPTIKIGILQLTNECSKGCSFCNEIFCPICVSTSSAEGEELSFADWKNVIDQLKIYGLEQLILTGGDISTVNYLNDLIQYTKEQNIITSICIVGGTKIETSEKSVIVNLLVRNELEIGRIVNNYKEFNNVNLYVFNKNMKGIEKVNKNWRVVTLAKDGVRIDKSSLFPVSIDRYFDRKMYDICLNSKITILSNGNIVPCLGAKNEVEYNIREDILPEIVRGLEKDYWQVSVDNSEVYPKCNSCGFRYACSLCRFTKVEEKCMYDEEKMAWK